MSGDRSLSSVVVFPERSLGCRRATTGADTCQRAARPAWSRGKHSAETSPGVAGRNPTTSVTGAGCRPPAPFRTRVGSSSFSGRSRQRTNAVARYPAHLFSYSGGRPVAFGVVEHYSVLRLHDNGRGRAALGHAGWARSVQRLESGFPCSTAARLTGCPRWVRGRGLPQLHEVDQYAEPGRYTRGRGERRVANSRRLRMVLNSRPG